MNKSVNRLAIAVSVLLLIFVFLVNQNPPINSIIVERQISQEKVAEMKISSWITWKKEPSTFVWQFPEQETIYVTKGEVWVTPDNSSQSVLIKKGDFAIFSAGLRCVWKVTQPFEKQVTLSPTPMIHYYWTIVFKAKSALRKLKNLIN